MLKKIFFILTGLFILSGCGKENYYEKCDRIVNVITMTVCNDYANVQEAYNKYNWDSKQSCFDDVKEDFMEVCIEQIEDGGKPFIIDVMKNSMGIVVK